MWHGEHSSSVCKANGTRWVVSRQKLTRGRKPLTIVDLNKFATVGARTRIRKSIDSRMGVRELARDRGTVELRIPETQHISAVPRREFMKARTTETKDPWNEGTAKPKIYGWNRFALYAAAFFSRFTRECDLLSTVLRKVISVAQRIVHAERNKENKS